MSQIAGRDRGQLRLYILAVALEVLRLRSVPSTAAGAGAVIAQRAAHPAVSIAPGKQGVDLRRRGVRSTKAQLDDATGDRIKLLASQRML